MAHGWIKLHRSLMDNKLWLEERFSKGQAWVDMILSANHRDEYCPFDGKLVLVKRGTFITSIHKLSKRWQWDRKTVSVFLDVLEQDEMIKRVSNSRSTLLIILNYDKYQSKDKEEEQGNEPEKEEEDSPSLSPSPSPNINRVVDSDLEDSGSSLSPSLSAQTRSIRNTKSIPNNIDNQNNNSNYAERNDLDDDNYCAAIILDDGSEWRPSRKDFDEYVKCYPNKDVADEFRRMRAWCISNPTKRKTKNGAKRFVNHWLAGDNSKYGRKKPIDHDEARRRFVNGQG